MQYSTVRPRTACSREMGQEGSGTSAPDIDWVVAAVDDDSIADLVRFVRLSVGWWRRRVVVNEPYGSIAVDVVGGRALEYNKEEEKKVDDPHLELLVDKTLFKYGKEKGIC
jgi:hypothetical protein